MGVRDAAKQITFHLIIAYNVYPYCQWLHGIICDYLKENCAYDSQLAIGENWNFINNLAMFVFAVDFSVFAD